ncbi:MAG: hypothetical protein ACHQ01_07785 [Candidatus Limnocylindrales bacterium]
MPENSLADEHAAIDRQLEAARRKFGDERLAVAKFNATINGGDVIAIDPGTAFPSGHPVVTRYPDRFRVRTDAQIERKLKSLRRQLEWAAAGA